MYYICAVLELKCFDSFVHSALRAKIDMIFNLSIGLVTGVLIFYLCGLFLIHDLDVVMWIILFGSYYAIMRFSVKQCEEHESIKFIFDHSIIPNDITRQIFSAILWQHKFNHNLSSSYWNLPSNHSPLPAKDFSDIYQTYHESIQKKTSYNFANLMIDGIHSFFLSIFICCFITMYPESDIASNIIMLYPFLILYIADFAMKSFNYISLIIPQFHWKSFIFLWLCVITDYFRLLLSISWSSHNQLFNLWQYELSGTAALVIFVVACLSITHSIDTLMFSCENKVLFLPKLITYIPCLFVIHSFYTLIFAELFAFTWIGIIVYQVIIIKFDKFYMKTESEILNDIISFLNDGSKTKQDVMYRVLAINKHLGFDHKLTQWIDKVVQKQADISYGDIKNNSTNSNGTRYSDHISYKSLYYKLKEHYPIDFKKFTVHGSIMNIFFIYTIVIILVPCYVLSRIFAIIYPLFIVGFSVKMIWFDVNCDVGDVDITVFSSILLKVYMAILVMLVVMIGYICTTYHKLWHVGVGYKLDEIANIKMKEIKRHYQCMTRYKAAYEVVFAKYGPDVGSVIMECLNDSFLSHLR